MMKRRQGLHPAFWRPVAADDCAPTYPDIALMNDTGRNVMRNDLGPVGAQLAGGPRR